MGWFLTLYLVLLAPFFFMGWCLCRVFTLAGRDVPRLYGVDLVGAALGTLLLFPLLQPLGPSRLLWCASLVSTAAALALAPSRRSRRPIIVAGLALLVAPDLLGARYLLPEAGHRP